MFLGGVYFRRIRSNDASGKPPCSCVLFGEVPGPCASTGGGTNRQNAPNRSAGAVVADRRTDVLIETYLPNNPPNFFDNALVASCFTRSFCSLAAFCSARLAMSPTSMRTLRASIKPVTVAGSVTRPCSCV